MSDRVSRVRLLGVGVLIVSLLYLAPFRMDDAYITYRYVANLVTGHGYVYNPGQWVEGASNLLWAVLLVPAYRLGLDLYITAAVLGGACWIGVYTVLDEELMVGDQESWTRLGLLVPLALVPVGPLWSVSGLETGFYQLLLAAGVVTGWPGPLFLGALTRPEGFLFLALLPFFRSDTNHTRHALYLWGFVLVCLARFYFYGSFLPTSVLAKSGPIIESFRGGLRYLAFGLRNHLGWLVTLIGLLGLLGVRDRWLRRRLLVLLFLQIAVVLRAGGDWMPYSRLLVPALIPLAVGWVASLRWFLSRWAPALLILVVVVIHVDSYPRVHRYTRHLNRSVIENQQAIREIVSWVPEEDPRTMALVDLGAFGWAARDWRVIDRVGLISPTIAQQGHGLYRNYDPDWVLAQKPTLIQTHLDGSVPRIETEIRNGVQFYQLNGENLDLADYATWPGGEALYNHESFQRDYYPLAVFQTPGNPVNVFWLRGAAGQPRRFVRRWNAP